ncbi:MAG: hypothetical protein DI541_19560 [Aeromonas media]|nr:MAG: hypothetical protein DI541_19560 [Aeromonas media]
MPFLLSSILIIFRLRQEWSIFSDNLIKITPHHSIFMPGFKVVEFRPRREVDWCGTFINKNIITNAYQNKQ